METHMVYTKYNGKIHEGMITMVLIAHKLILFDFGKSIFGILCLPSRLCDEYKTPSYQLALNLVIKRITVELAR
jgi:hypothetical protein